MCHSAFFALQCSAVPVQMRIIAMHCFAERLARKVNTSMRQLKRLNSHRTPDVFHQYGDAHCTLKYYQFTKVQYFTNMGKQHTVYTEVCHMSMCLFHTSLQKFSISPIWEAQCTLKCLFDNFIRCTTPIYANVTCFINMQCIHINAYICFTIFVPYDAHTVLQCVKHKMLYFAQRTNL